MISEDDLKKPYLCFQMKTGGEWQKPDNLGAKDYNDALSIMKYPAKDVCKLPLIETEDQFIIEDLREGGEGMRYILEKEIPENAEV